jgi:L-fuconolactonase
MRTDAHQHFWRYDPAEHGWMSDRMTAIKRDFLPQDLKPLMDSAGFETCVAVQARQSVAETEWLLSLALQHSFIAGVVGWVDLRSDDLEGQLQRLTAHPKLVGLRHVVQDEPDDAFMLGEAFQRGIAMLHGFGLTYDLLLLPKHLPVAVELVRRFPEQRFVLDHIAKPMIEARAMTPWEQDLNELARSPNVYCKVSGMVTEASWTHWKAEDFTRYLDVAFESFGAERLMIGSDWPVCTLAAEYQATMNLVVDYVQQFSGSVQAAVLGGNCARFYGISFA